MIRTKVPTLVGILFLLVASQTVKAVTVQLHYGDGFWEGSPQRQAIEWAAERWEAKLLDPIVVTIDVAFDDLTSFREAALGISRFNQLEVSYVDVRAALLEDQTSADDRTATSYLPPGPNVAFRTWDPQGNVITSNGSDTINRVLSLPLANAKALRLPVTDDSELVDGTIRFNERLLDEIRTDFDPSNGVRGLDFVGLAAHEIGHALGFTSGVQLADATCLPNGPDAPEDLRGRPVLETLDLFRYSNASVPLLDLAPGGRPYFSIDGGATELAPFASGEFNGDGFDPSHWTLGHGLMDPTLSPFTVVEIQPLDLWAMDVIGWDLVTVPEPAGDVLILSSFVAILLRQQRRIRRVHGRH